MPPRGEYSALMVRHRAKLVAFECHRRGQVCQGARWSRWGPGYSQATPALRQLVRPKEPPARRGETQTMKAWLYKHAAVCLIASRTPAPSTTRWRFEPRLTRSVGLGPVFSPPSGASTLAESRAARSHSIRPASPKRSSSVWWSHSRIGYLSVYD